MAFPKFALAACCAIIAAIASVAGAQVRPQPGAGDPHIQTVAYRNDQVVQLEAAFGYQLMIVLAADEEVQTVAIGDSGAWLVSANRAGNQLFIKPTQAGANTNMTVVTSVRIYYFDLSVASGGMPSAYTVRFTYPSAMDADDHTDRPMIGLYKVGGARALRPDAISDDGQQTYITWPADASMPAIYVISPTGQETLSNGSMRDGIFVIDGVHDHLIFRVDRHVARADRLRKVR